jgi:hypothetical protein
LLLILLSVAVLEALNLSSRELVVAIHLLTLWDGDVNLFFVMITDVCRLSMVGFKKTAAWF